MCYIELAILRIYIPKNSINLSISFASLVPFKMAITSLDRRNILICWPEQNFMILNFHMYFFSETIFNAFHNFSSYNSSCSVKTFCN